MLSRTGLTVAGSVLLTRLAIEDRQAQWVRYQFLAAFGAGICRQIGFSAVPLVLPDDDAATGSALVAFCNSLGPTLAIVMGQSIFTNLLQSRLDGLADLNVPRVIDEGAANLSAVVPPELLGAVEQAFGEALKRCFWLSVASAGVALGASGGMEWIDVRKKH